MNFTTKQFFTRLRHFMFQNLKDFPRVSIHFVSKTQRSNGVRSRSLPPRFTEQNDATSWPARRCHISSMMQRLQWVTPHYSVSCHDNWKIVSGGRKPILAVSWPAWACVWQHFASATAWDLVETKAASNICRSLGAHWRGSNIVGGQRFDVR
jgi:hypothetical protein